MKYINIVGAYIGIWIGTSVLFLVWMRRTENGSGDDALDVTVALFYGIIWPLVLPCMAIYFAIKRIADGITKQDDAG